MPETPQPQQNFDPRKRLPIGMKVPDELKGAIAEYEAKIAEQRKKIGNMN